MKCVRECIKNIKKRILRLLEFNNTPEEIALGVAIGILIAIMPVYGLHTVLVVLFAILIRRSNKIAMFIGTNISNIFTLPFITWIGYSIGRLMVGQDYPRLSWVDFKGILNYRSIADLYYPLFIGSFILGLILAIIAYFVTVHLLKKRKKAAR